MHAAASPRRPGFAAADQAFDLLQFIAIDLPRLLVAERFQNAVQRRASSSWFDAIKFVEVAGEFAETNRVVVEHRDIAGRLIGHVNFVPLIDQPNERAAHRNHVVVRMRREHEHALGENVVVRMRPIARLLCVAGFAAGPAGDGRLQMPETLDVDVVGRPVLGQQILQAFFVVVFVGELEDRLFDVAGEPDDGFANFRFVPLHRAKRHGRRLPRQRGGRRFVEQNFRVRMFLQEAGGESRRDLAFDRPGDDRRLVLAERQHDELPCGENRADAHRDRLPRHVLFAEEIAGGVEARDAVERDQPRAAVAAGARLVEADVAGAADAEELNIDPAGLRDLLFVLLAEIVHFSTRESCRRACERLPDRYRRGRTGAPA